MCEVTELQKDMPEGTISGEFEPDEPLLGIERKRYPSASKLLVSLWVQTVRPLSRICFCTAMKEISC